MKINEITNRSNIKENFLKNLVGDIRNAFKPGVAVTPNMVKELEAGLAAIQRGETPTNRQQATMNNFMSDTLAREIKKTFGVDIEEGILDFLKGADASGLSNIGNMIGKTQSDINTVARKARELMDQNMPDQQIIQALRQEFGVNQSSARTAVGIARNNLFDDTLHETNASSVAAVAMPVGGMRSRSQYNADGTAKNALDGDNVLSNGKPKTKKKKSSSSN